MCILYNSLYFSWYLTSTRRTQVPCSRWIGLIWTVAYPVRTVATEKVLMQHYHFNYLFYRYNFQFFIHPFFHDDRVGIYVWSSSEGCKHLWASSSIRWKKNCKLSMKFSIMLCFLNILATFYLNLCFYLSIIFSSVFNTFSTPFKLFI